MLALTSGRDPKLALVCAAERGLGLVTDLSGNYSQWHVGGSNAASSKSQAKLSQEGDRCHLDDSLKLAHQSGSGRVGPPRQFLKCPRMGWFSQHAGQRSGGVPAHQQRKDTCGCVLALEVRPEHEYYQGTPKCGGDRRGPEPVFLQLALHHTDNAGNAGGITSLSPPKDDNLRQRRQYEIMMRVFEQKAATDELCVRFADDIAFHQQFIV